MHKLTIGKIATQAAMSIDTIRYYERAGLIAPPERGDSGYRQYDGEVVKRLQFIRRAKDLGFTLAEIAELLTLSSQGERDMGAMKDAAQAKLATVEKKISELLRIRGGLTQLVAACPGHGALAGCPIVSALNEDPS